MSAVAQAERDALARAAATVRWWPAAMALVLVGIAYALVSDRLTVGPRWALLVVAVVAVIVARVLHWRGLLYARRWTVIVSLAAVTAAITTSAAFLFVGLLNHSVDPSDLLQGGALLWASNIVLFGLWYWEVDGGGPAHRLATACGSTDFAFPQTILGDGNHGGWEPEFFDYLFLAFNTSTAFSPTDTMVLARRSKLLMMYQSVVSLATVVVLVARAINAL
jgi:hypothetical protein